MKLHTKDGTILDAEGRPLAAPFDDIVRDRAARDVKFRRGLLREAMDCLLASEIGPAKSMLRNYINATIGFEGLSVRTKIPSKSLYRMFSRTGNPQAHNLFTVLTQLQQVEGIRLTTTVQKIAPVRKAS
jgi:DNA-binding phage protein